MHRIRAERRCFNGAVTLSNCSHATFELRCWPSRHGCVLPNTDSFTSEQVQCFSGNQMTLDVEDDGMGGEKLSGGFCWLKPLHSSLTLLNCKM